MVRTEQNQPLTGAVPEEIRQLSALIIRNSFMLDQPQAMSDADIQATAQYFADNPARMVYTSFDGDHMEALNSLRMQVYDAGAVPVDPEAILGFKDCSDYLRPKRRILHADLTLLAHCDEQWVLTDYPAVEESAVALAEGVVAELVFFLRGHRTPQRIPFIPLEHVFLGNAANPPSAISLSYDRLIELLPGNMEGVKEFADYNPTEFPLVYIGDTPALTRANDPIMRQAGQRSLRRRASEYGAIGIVPSLATPAADVRNNWHQLLAARTAHMRMCSELWIPTLGVPEQPSPLSRFYEAVWSCITADQPRG